jgi:hypothetical protein
VFARFHRVRRDVINGAISVEGSRAVYRAEDVTCPSDPTAETAVALCALTSKMTYSAGEALRALLLWCIRGVKLRKLGQLSAVGSFASVLMSDFPGCVNPTVVREGSGTHIVRIPIITLVSVERDIERVDDPVLDPEL